MCEGGTWSVRVEWNMRAKSGGEVYRGLVGGGWMNYGDGLCGVEYSM